MEKLLSPAGDRLESAVAGSFGRDLVLAFYASVETLVKTSQSVLSSTNGNADGNGGGGEGWAETVLTALAVPSNRKLVLDLTGRVTFEAVRSFLEFVLCTMAQGPVVMPQSRPDCVS